MSIQIAKKALMTPSLLVRSLVEMPRAVSVAKYHEKVIDHYEKPRNVGSLDKKSDDVGTGLVGAPACGDVMKLQVTHRVASHSNNKVLNCILMFQDQS